MAWFEYFSRALSVWLIGFAPGLGVYVAIPAGIALGMDTFSTLFWSIFGTYAPVLLVHLFYTQLLRIERLRYWFTRPIPERRRHLLDTYGPWFVLLSTAWLGVWTLSITVKVLRMNQRAFMLYAFLSVTGYGLLIMGLIVLGFDMASPPPPEARAIGL